MIEDVSREKGGLQRADWMRFYANEFERIGWQPYAACLDDVPHPGEFVREEIEAREWSQRDLAYILGVPEQAVGLILSGKRGISPEMAKALGKAFDVSADYFANLQQAFEMSNARAPDPAVEPICGLTGGRRE